MISGGMMLLLFFVQRMQANMDPEERAEMLKMQQEYSIANMMKKAQDSAKAK
jgi:hypothetical protein